jgi:hypothetical protein
MLLLCFLPMERCTWYCFMLSSLSITSSFLQQYNLIIYSETIEGATWLWSYGSWIYNYLCNRCQSPLTLWVWTPFIVRSTTSCDKVCQWLASGRWFSPGTPVSSKIKQTTLNQMKPYMRESSLIFWYNRSVKVEIIPGC